MKKNTTILGLLMFFLAFGSQAQTIFTEDFNGGNSLTGWTLFNVDARTPAANVAQYTDAWIVVEDFDTVAGTTVIDSAAASTSWYSPAGAADDYLVTPAIVLTAGNKLEFQAKAQDANFRDGYELRISTTTPTVAGLLANPALFTVGAENATWTNRSIDLGAAGYANQTVYLAWRNNSNDMFILLVDNIKVFKPAAVDVGVSAILSPGSNCFFGTADSVTVEITNFGLASISNIPVRYVFNNAPPLVLDTFRGTIPAGGTANFTFTTGTVNVGTPGSYTLTAATLLATDGNPGNDGINGFQIVNAPATFPYTENFDGLTAGDNGVLSNGWQGTTSGSGSFQWFANTGATGSVATGPNSDNTSGTGLYMYSEASTPAAAGDEVFLTSPCIDLSAASPSRLGLTFWYHMYGADIQTLFVDVDNNGNWVTVDSIVGQQQTANADAFRLRFLSLDAYASLSFLKIRFRTTRGASFNGDVAIDDISLYEPAANDAAVFSLNAPSSVQSGGTVTVSGVIRNAGYTPISSLKVNWSSDGGTTVNTDSIAIVLQPGATSSFTHSVVASASTPGSYINLDVWVSDPDNLTDGNNSNDTLSADVWVWTNTGNNVQRKAVLEEYTTAVCQFCPDGTVVVEQVLAQNPNVIAVGVHACFGTDAMTNVESSEICATLGNNSAPTGMIDRTVYAGETSAAVSRNTWLSRANARAAQPAPVGVSVSGTYVPGATTASVTVTASFSNYPDMGGFNVSLMVLEDSVTGSGAGYNQVNAYNTQTGHPYAGAGNPIVGFPHRHVLRDILPSTFGDATVIPSNIALNTPYSRTFTVNIPANWDYEQMSVVATVNYAGPGISNYQILNAEEVKLSQLTTGLSEVVSNVNGVELAPNPTTDFSKLQFNLVRNSNVQLSVMDVTGKVVQEQYLGVMTKGRQQAIIDATTLENGFYFVNLRVGDEQITRKISVMH